MNADSPDPSSRPTPRPDESGPGASGPDAGADPGGATRSAEKTRTDPGAASGAEHARRPEAVVGTKTPATGKADLTKRLLAGLVDGVAAVLISFIPIAGGIAATAYWLVRDGLDVEFMANRSLGKKVMGLKPLTLDGRPVDLETSVRRNWPFAIGGIASILAFIPIIGWILMIPVVLVAVAAVAIEVFLVVTDDEGRRFGDKFADTRVVETGDAMV